MTRACGVWSIPALALLLAASAVLASGGSSESTSPAPVKTPADQANEHYNAGLALRDQAWRMEKKLADETTPEEKRKKLGKKIQATYERAIKELGTAIELNPQFHQAYSSLGYSYRRAGNLDSAMLAYDTALELSPRYAVAIEYRAEAYLALNRIDDAKAAYDDLAAKDPKLAAELLSAMSGWIEHRRAEPVGVNVGELDSFERWVDERQDGEPRVASSLRKTRSW